MWLLIHRIVKNVYIYIAASIMASMFTWNMGDCSQTKKMQHWAGHGSPHLSSNRL